MKTQEAEAQVLSRPCYPLDTKMSPNCPTMQLNSSCSSIYRDIFSQNKLKKGKEAKALSPTLFIIEGVDVDCYAVSYEIQQMSTILIPKMLQADDEIFVGIRIPYKTPFYRDFRPRNKNYN